MTTARKVQLALLLPSSVIVIAWIWESVVCGRCFVSQNLAPLAIIGILIVATVGLLGRPSN